MDVGASPKTQQKYAIKSMVVSLIAGHGGDAVTECNEEGPSACIWWVSKTWVDCLYEMYPNVFDRSGTPVVLTAEQSTLTDVVPGFERSGMRSFFGKIGFLTLLPLIPVENVSSVRWRIKIIDNAGEPSEALVDTVCERIESLTPLGFLCFYDSDARGHVQAVTGLPWSHDAEILRKQMEALGLSIASELEKMESAGRLCFSRGRQGIGDASRQTGDESLARRLIVSKKKELEDLKSAGIISAREFEEEMKRLKGDVK